MDEFMDAMKQVFPNLLVQFEDFSTDNAFKYLNRYRDRYRVFNDDVRFLMIYVWASMRCSSDEQLDSRDWFRDPGWIHQRRKPLFGCVQEAIG